MNWSIAFFLLGIFVLICGSTKGWALVANVVLIIFFFSVAIAFKVGVL